jgi:hypothetical protein
MPEFDVDKYIIPPLVKDMISKLRDVRSPLHIRNNYKLMLENIATACQAEITHFLNQPTTAQPIKKKKPVAKKF